MGTRNKIHQAQRRFDMGLGRELKESEDIKRALAGEPPARKTEVPEGPGEALADVMLIENSEIATRAPRKNTVGNYDELSRLRHKTSGEVTLDNGESVCHWQYNPETEEIEYFP